MKSSVVNKFGFISSIITFSGILLFGIAFSAIIFLLNKPVPENYIETEAKIIRIEEELSPTCDQSDGIGPEDYDHFVFIEYSYNGKTYSDKEIGNYDSSMKKGGKVTVYVNPDDPDDFMCDPAFNNIFMVIGVVIILIGAGGIGYSIYKKKKKENN